MAVVKGISFSLTTTPSVSWHGIKVKGDGPELTDDVVRGSYVNDYNIEKIDALIRKKLDHQSTNRVDELRQQLIALSSRLGEWLSVIVKKSLLKEYQNIEEEMQKLMEGVDLRRYLEKATPLLELYRQIRPRHQSRTFGTKEELNESDEDKFRRMVIDQYLELARQFIRVEICNDTQPLQGCTVCGQKDPLMEDDGILRCLHCKAESIAFSKESGVVAEAEALTTRNNHDNRKTFKDWIEFYQGKEPPRPPAVYERLDRYCTMNGLPTGAQIKALTTDDWGRKPNTSLQLLHRLLQATNQQNQYKHARLIAHEYWGWELQDLSDCEAKMLEDYDLTQTILLQIKDPGKSSLNIEFRGLCHIRMAGKPVHPDDILNVCSTREIIESRQELFSRICRIAGLDFQPFI